MSIIRLTEAPLKVEVVYPDYTLEKVWLQYMGDVADSLSGYWGKQSRTIVVEGTETPDVNLLVVQSNMVQISLQYGSLDSVSATGTIPKQYAVIDGIIQMAEVDGTGNVISITWISVEDSTFKIPETSTTNKVIISGNLIRR